MSIVTNGLILALDAANINSYKSSSATWTDMSGYGNSMSHTNTPSYTTQYGGGIVYNGSNNYSTISGTENQITSSAVTVELIFSIHSNTFTGGGGNTTDQFIVFRHNTSTGGNFEGYTVQYSAGSSQGMSFQVTSTGGVTNIGATIGLGSVSRFDIPMIITATYDSSFIKVYVNGVFSSQAATGFALNYNSTSLVIGGTNSAWVGFFNGTIYSYKQYNRTLSQTEIVQNYNDQKARFGLS